MIGNISMVNPWSKGIKSINDALAVGIEDDVLSMALHYNLGECSGQRKPRLDLLGRQDIADSASFMEAWKCLT